MASLFEAKDKALLNNIHAFAKKCGIELYLVGGYLRDIILKRKKENPDIDFCLGKNSISFGKRLAKKLGAGFVILDKERGCCRLVKKQDNRIYTVDLTDFRGKLLKDDLLRRDFTINALSLELGSGLACVNLDKDLIDPCNGRKDIKSKIIRVINGKSFDEDPLRILRAFSLSAIFGFKIDKKTLSLIKSKRNKLARVSYERIREELFKILGTDNSFDYVSKLDELGILKIIIPEIEVMRGVKQGPYHHLDVWRHSLESLRQIELLIRELKNDKRVQDYLNESVSGERRRRSLIKLGALLHDIGKPKAMRHEDGKTKFHGHERIGSRITQDAARRLKLSNDELDSLEKMVFWHLRPGYLADNEEITPRASFRYFRDTSKEAVSVLLISIADQRSTRGPLTTVESRLRHEEVVFDLIREYFRRLTEKKLKRLVDGNDLMKEFKLSQSPLVGKILTELEELQAIGKIKTKKEALGAAKKFLITRS